MFGEGDNDSKGTVSPASLDRTARVAGALYLLLPFLGFFSFVVVPSAVLVRDDAAATARNMVEAGALVRSGAISHLVSQIVVVFLALAMYRLLRIVDRDGAVLMAALALLGVPISFVAEVKHLAVLALPSVDGGILAPEQIELQATLLLEQYTSAVLAAQVFWSLWLVVMGWLVLRSRFLPRLLGIAVVIAAGGYLTDSAAHLLGLDLPTISQFTFIAEIALPIWLLVKGVDPAGLVSLRTDPSPEQSGR